MASSADLVYRNFRYRIEAISPADTSIEKSLRFVDPGRVRADQSAGTSRTFSIYWKGSVPPDDSECSDLTFRDAVHTFELEVNYSTKMELERMSRVMLQDRHDIIKALRDPDGFVGHADAITADVGLQSRDIVSDESVLNPDAQTAILRQRYRCRIFETE